MLLRPDQLASHLSAKTLAPLYLLHGDEPLLVIEAADAIRSKVRHAGYTERETLITGASFKWDSLRLSAANLSLFGDNKLIDLRIPTGKPGRDGADALQHYCKHLPENVILLIILPKMDWQAKKAAWFNTLEKTGIAIELNAPKLAELPNWIAQRLARQQQQADREALGFLAQHTEGNLLAAHQEIQKLALLYPQGALSLAQVEEAVLNVARYDLDMFRESLMKNSASRCARLLEGLRAIGSAPPLLLWALTTEIRKPNRLAPAQHRTALLHAAKIDRIIKGVASGDVWDEFLQLALRLCQKKAYA